MVHGNCWMRRSGAAAAGRPPDVSSVREKIAARLNAGTLPQELPEKMRGGYGGDHACSICDDPILATQVEYIYEMPGEILRLHIGCCGLWQAELLRRGVQHDR